MLDNLTAKEVDELATACMELPWLDEVRVGEGNQISVTIIPSDDVSTEEKLMMTFGGSNSVLQRLMTLVDEVATELNWTQPITVIVHGGGAQYTFLRSDGCLLSIPNDDFSGEMYLRVLFLLKEISLTVQTLMVVEASQ